MAIWLLRSVLAERPGRTRGDHLRDAIFAKASATWPVDGPEKNAAVTLAWNAKFWLTVQEIQTRVAPEQPADQDPGHPELELWWHQEAFP